MPLLPTGNARERGSILCLSQDGLTRLQVGSKENRLVENRILHRAGRRGVEKIGALENRGRPGGRELPPLANLCLHGVRNEDTLRVPTS